MIVREVPLEATARDAQQAGDCLSAWGQDRADQSGVTLM